MWANRKSNSASLSGLVNSLIFLVKPLLTNRPFQPVTGLVLMTGCTVLRSVVLFSGLPRSSRMSCLLRAAISRKPVPVCVAVRPSSRVWYAGESRSYAS